MGHSAYQNWNTSVKKLCIGLICSLIFLGVMYTLVSTQALPRPFLTSAIMGLAFLQASVQLVCFLHLGSETSPLWNTLLFLFMLAIMLIVVVGSVYIMYNLNYHMM